MNTFLDICRAITKAVDAPLHPCDYFLVNFNLTRSICNYGHRAPNDNVKPNKTN